MKHRQTWRGIGLLVAVLTTCASAEVHEPANLRASYQATKFGISISYDLQIHRRAHDAEALAWMWLPHDSQAETRSQTSNEPLIHVTLHNRALTTRAETDVLLEPTTARAIQRIARRYRDTYTSFKAIQFGDAGIRLLRLRDSGPLSEIDWRRAKPRFRPYPTGFDEGHDVTDASALFALVSRDAMQQPGNKMQLPVFSEDHLLMVELAAVEHTGVPSDVVEITAGAEQRRAAEREAMLVNISATHLDPTARAKDLVLLGMQGGLTMLVDREWRTPLQIRGNLPNIGEVVLRLSRIELLNR